MGRAGNRQAATDLCMYTYLSFLPMLPFTRVSARHSMGTVRRAGNTRLRIPRFLSNTILCLGWLAIRCFFAAHRTGCTPLPIAWCVLLGPLFDTSDSAHATTCPVHRALRARGLIWRACRRTALAAHPPPPATSTR